MKNNYNDSFKYLIFGISTFFCLNLNAQQKIGGWWIPGTTPGSGTFTKISAYTDSSLGVGVSNPLGKAEILYCPPNNSDYPGLVVTKKDCYAGMYFVNPGDGLFNDAIPLVGAGGDNPPSYVPSPVSPIHHYTSFTPLNFNLNVLNNNQSPLIWGRVQTPVNSGGISAGDDSRFIVFPDGRTGINVASPRCALDVRGFGVNKPAAIFGINAQRPSFTIAGNPIDQRYTKHIEIVPHLSRFGYNRISQDKDLGIFFTDGLGNLGTNLSGALVIAPWRDTSESGRNAGGMRIDNVGNVEITKNLIVSGGMTIPGYLNNSLEIRGSVKCTTLYVNQQWWPDYVFNKNYQLLNIDSLDNYIAVNHRLPIFPSAGEIKEKGQDIGLLQKLQQQSIEELTLYLIDQNHKLQHQEKEINDIKTKLKELEKAFSNFSNLTNK